MTERIRRAIVAALIPALLLCNPARALTDLCTNANVSFLFFNGVWNTYFDAGASLFEMRALYGTTTPRGERIRYELFYNQSSSKLGDIVEVFQQRATAQGAGLETRLELLHALTSPVLPWWGTLAEVAGVAALKQALDQDTQDALAKGLKQLTQRTITTNDYAEHRTRLDALALEGRRLLMFAHSQGNLFANVAYDYAAARLPPSALRLIHVAPASPTLRGSYTLADLDLVINVGLRSLGGQVPAATTAIPVSRPPGLAGETDPAGHALLAIYLNPSLATASRIRTHVDEALANMVAPNARGTSGFLTATLTWNGWGDADLHVIEPDGAHVYWRNQSSTGGFLDVDDRIGFGPEHYFASCDASRLKLGRYTIGVTNYDGADGLTATLQVSSAADGILGTQATRLQPSFQSSFLQQQLFVVEVAKQAGTGRVTARVLQ